ncbi:MAG: M20 family metallopeptidase [Desulfobacteraceae bacterium]|nr:M20 family metallopeptidase [Desulfobacteraceae bacterium]
MTEKLLLSFHDWLSTLRRDFHEFPELAYREERTAAKIAEVLDKLEIPFRTGIGGTGIVASLATGRPGPTVALRADMDALPLEEKADVPFRSKNAGRMHACGHDAHMAIALGTARLLIERGWQDSGTGRVLLIFQPAEEGGGGANAMLDSGAFDGEQISAVFSGHVHPELPAGRIGIARDVCNAASDAFVVKIVGKGGHGAYPDLCRDPIVAGAHLVAQLQTIVSRDVSPMKNVVVTIGKFQAGTARNIIPDEAWLEGTVRTLDPELRAAVLSRLEEIARGIGISHRVSCTVQMIEGYPLLVNDPSLVKYATRIGEEILGVSNVGMENPRMGSEDFAYFAQMWPGILVRLGCGIPGEDVSPGLHSAWFEMDESVLDIGVRLFAGMLEKYAEAQECL